jgi:hypothetical protein
MEEYKLAMKALKEKAKTLSIEDSEHCWKIFPGKQKAKYTDCGQKACIAYHVFSRGKREMQLIKRKSMKECELVFQPDAIKACRNNVYNEMIPHINSLEKWIHRERDKFRSEFS